MFEINFRDHFQRFHVYVEYERREGKLVRVVNKVTFDPNFLKLYTIWLAVSHKFVFIFSN